MDQVYPFVTFDSNSEPIYNFNPRTGMSGIIELHPIMSLSEANKGDCGLYIIPGNLNKARAAAEGAGNAILMANKFAPAFAELAPNPGSLTVWSPNNEVIAGFVRIIEC